MSSQKPRSQFTQLLTQAVQSIQSKVNFSALVLKKGSKVPELKIKDSSNNRNETFALLGDRYTIGRSSKSCDISIRNPVVSQVHCSLNRDRANPKAFILRDENSTNGIYKGKRRLKTARLHNGDIISLGPPELATGVKLEYHFPLPHWFKYIRYTLYGTGGFIGLVSLSIWLQWRDINVKPLPTGLNAPNMVYAGDRQTQLNPISNRTHRELKNLSDFSPYLPKAVIASEDSRFYWHLGVDPYGIARAMFINYKQGEFSQGASTLTQQLARSVFSQVGRQDTAGRKLREAIVALKLEATYSKREILKAYLNRVYLGVGNGFEDAAQFYFDKSAADLTLSEAATLVGILPAPNSYNPVRDYDTAVKQRNLVINRMARMGMVSQQEANKARRSRIEVSPKARQTLSNAIAPYFYSYVFEELRALLGNDLAREGNFIVETALDVSLQKKANTTLRSDVVNNGSRFGYSQGAIVTLDSKTGQILALTGGVDYGKSQFNRATNALRQPGSTFKLFAYTAAIEAGIAPEKKYSCAPFLWEGQAYKPCERSSGEIDMYRGLAQSENVVALRVAREVGLDKVIEMARRLGVTSKLISSPGLVLGESETNVLEMTGAYATFANQGVWNRPHAIARILDGNDCQDYRDRQTCRVIYSFSEDRSNYHRSVISEALANQMTRMMQAAVSEGTGRAANIRPGIAGKTGTTDDNVDLWFIGYLNEPSLVTGVWLGNDNNKPTWGSSSQAASLWGKYLKEVLEP
ncbi:MAG: PBP1A family penicillin-binding protein [Xenococcaceae cyanobacterium]